MTAPKRFQLLPFQRCNCSWRSGWCLLVQVLTVMLVMPGSSIGSSVPITALPLPGHSTHATGCLLTTIAKSTGMTPMSSTCTMNIALPEPLRAYVAERVESGQYGNTSEYVRELIRKDQREQAITRLRALVEQGLASGPATPHTQADWDDLRAMASGSPSSKLA